MPLKRIYSLCFLLATLAWTSCSSTSSDTTSVEEATATEESAAESAAASLAQSLVTSTSSLTAGVGFQASESCSPYSFETTGDVTDTDLGDGVVRTTFDAYTLAFDICSETDDAGDSVCVEDCSAEFLSSSSFGFDGEIEIGTTETDAETGSFDFTYNDLIMSGSFDGDSFSLALDGSFSGEYSATELSATYTDFSMSSEDSEETFDFSADGTLTYDVISETMDGTLTLTVNGHTVTCTFTDYVVGTETTDICS